MSANRLLSQLEGVKRTGSGSWLARCPAHDDRRPSLSIRECDDRRVLVYCFTSCGAVDVLDALGLEWGDLFPGGPGTYPQIGKRRRTPPIPARDALVLLAQESLVVEIIAHRIAEGEPVEHHRADLELAAGRIGAIRQIWMGAR